MIPEIIRDSGNTNSGDFGRSTQRRNIAILLAKVRARMSLHGFQDASWMVDSNLPRIAILTFFLFL
jgi:hypothetical protein